jgi:hypothetical protein
MEIPRSENFLDNLAPLDHGSMRPSGTSQDREKSRVHLSGGRSAEILPVRRRSGAAGVSVEHPGDIVNKRRHQWFECFQRLRFQVAASSNCMHCSSFSGIRHSAFCFRLTFGHLIPTI